MIQDQAQDKKSTPDFSTMKKRAPFQRRADVPVRHFIAAHCIAELNMDGPVRGCPAASRQVGKPGCPA